eukprot:4573-Eustigmatos_ZCMA.PRE.1
MLSTQLGAGWFVHGHDGFKVEKDWFRADARRPPPLGGIHPMSAGTECALATAFAAHPAHP